MGGVYAMATNPWSVSPDLHPPLTTHIGPHPANRKDGRVELGRILGEGSK